LLLEITKSLRCLKTDRIQGLGVKGVAQVVEKLPRRPEALGLIPSIAKSKIR
jgi:hypothetical protein